MNEPVADAARSLLDGHVELSRRIAERGRFPAVDVLASVSRVMTQVWALGALAGVGFALFVLFNKPKVVDFLIATEHEMKKVSWPTRKEIIGSTAVVICGTFAFSLLMFVIDFVFAWLFQAIRIIEIG